MSDAAQFKVGDEVKWRSQAGGHTKDKAGVVIEVVPPGADPKAHRREGFLRRSSTSYVVRVRRRTYWPHASALRPATVESQ